MTPPKLNRERLQLLFELLNEFGVHAVGKEENHIFMSFEEVGNRVIYRLHEQAQENNGSFVKLDTAGSVFLHGEFNIVDIVQLAITNERLNSSSHQKKMEDAIEKYGPDVCIKCYGQKKLSFWTEQPKPKTGFEKVERPCPVCSDSSTE